MPDVFHDSCKITQNIIMEDKIIGSLKTLSYEITEDVFRAAVTEAPKSAEYAKIVHFITNELRSLCSIDEEVNIIATPEDSVSFLMEVSSFLKELGCPHQALSQGELLDRLITVDDKLLLLDYLIAELMASRILQEGKPDKQIKLKLQESPEAHDLQTILKTLQCAKPPENVAVKDLFDKLMVKAEAVVTERGKDLLLSPIWNHQISEQQWEKLNTVEKDLHMEYTIRRKMMLQRLDCTIQSFQWSDKMKGKSALIMKTYTTNRKQLKVEPDIDVSSLLAARDDLAILEKTSNSSVRKNTQSEITKILIGKVPDRGGRTSEQAPPPPEMPSFQQRQEGGRGGRGGGGRGGFDRGGRGNRSWRGGQQGDYGGNDQGGYNRNNSARGGNSSYYDNNQQKQQNFDSAGTYTTSYHQSSGNYSRPQSNDKYSGGHYAGNQSYGNQRPEEYYQNDPKRPKTFDSFQNQRTTYADQYVQETNYNQQHHPRNRGGGRGRNNYQGGGGQGRGRDQYYY